VEMTWALAKAGESATSPPATVASTTARVMRFMSPLSLPPWFSDTELGLSDTERYAQRRYRSDLRPM